MNSKVQVKSTFRKYSVAILLVTIFVFQLGYFVFLRSGYHDFATFLIAKDLIASGRNPYEGNIFRNGFLLIYPIWIYAKIFGTFLGPGIWNLLNIAGLAFLCHLIKPNMSWLTRGLVIVTLLFTSPARSMLANVQHTGIIIGLLSLVFLFANKPQSLYFDFASALLLLTAFELKPQTTIPLILFLLFFKKRLRTISFWLAATLLIHLMMSVYYGKSLDILWLRSLASLSDNSILIKAGDNSLWGVASYLFGYPKIWSVLSYLAYAIALFLISNFKKLKFGSRGQLIVVLITPLSLSYVHPYDFVVVALLAILFVAEGGWSQILKTCLVLLLVPTMATGRNFPIYLLVALVIYAGFIFSIKPLRVSWSTLKSELWPILALISYSLTFYSFEFDQLRIGILYASVLFLFFGWGLQSFRIQFNSFF